MSKTVQTVAAAGLALTLLTCPVATARAQQNTAPSVTVAPVVRQAINPTYTFVGQTQAVQEVDLRARVEGFLQQRLFTEGENVQEGDLLYVIEKTSYEAEVNSRKAALDEAKASLALSSAILQRRQQAVKTGAISKVDVDIAAAEEQVAAAHVEAAQADLQKADLNLSYTEVKAPLSGRIGRTTYNVGNLVGPDSGSLAQIVKLDPIYVNFSVSESVYLDLRQAPGENGGSAGERKSRSRFTLELSNDTEYPHEGELNLVDPTVDPSTGTVSARLLFPNPDRLLLPGQYVVVQVQAKKVEELGLVVPQAAVQEDQAGWFVLVVNKDNTVEIRRVTMGERVGINWEVKDGLAEGELVIYQGIQKARPGGKVDPVVAAPADPGNTAQQAAPKPAGAAKAQAPGDGDSTQ